MQLDAITIALRPRNHWEAIDLGFDMVRTWWKPIFSAWLLVVLPVAVVINLFCWDRLWLSTLLLWWLKPLFDRIPLYILSRTVFGDTPTIKTTLSAILPLWRKNGLWNLTLGRFDMARSFNMPVSDLEGLHDKKRRQRLKILHKKTGSSAVWLTIVCIHLDMVLNISLVVMLYLLLPQAIQGDFIKLVFTASQNKWLEILLHAFDLLAMTVIEPFYVAAGFALYLNRRTILEGWDIEIAFRRMAEQRRAASNIFSAGVLIPMLIVVTLGNALFFSGQSFAATTTAAAAPPTVSTESPQQLKQRISQVLQQPEFQTTKIERHWKFTGKLTHKNQPHKPSAWMKLLAEWVPSIARIFEWLLWLLLAAVIGWLISNHRRWMGWSGYLPAIIQAQPAKILFGLDIQPQSLPDNIVECAWQLYQDGQYRPALSLLYRGALADWARRGSPVLGVYATEGECMYLFRAGAARETGDYFCRLTHAWQNTAYADRQPPIEEMQRLCRDWNLHFRTTG